MTVSIFYLAPMQEVTGYVYRNVYHAMFGDMDKYFTPFLVPHVNKDFNTKEKNEIVPEHNQGQKLVPQILTKNAEDFVRTANILITTIPFGEPKVVAFLAMVMAIHLYHRLVHVIIQQLLLMEML